MSEHFQVSFSDTFGSMDSVLAELFHLQVMGAMVVILSGVGASLLWLTKNKMTFLFFMEEQTVEFVWTFLPAIFIVGLGYVSVSFLYDSAQPPAVSSSLKVVGHQWYWTYEYGVGQDLILEVSSVMAPPSGGIRLLDTSASPTLSSKSEYVAYITSADVLHSWSVPGLGVKVDACPGRLNAARLSPSSPGVFYGQCSEICGANHSFMPISVEFV